jgi:SPP1 family predicted phage head-tail adaptor
MIDRQVKKTLASEFKHRVTIQELTITPDGEGGFSESWNDTSVVYAAVYPMSAKQLMEYKTIGVEATHIIKIRGDVDIKTTL